MDDDTVATPREERLNAIYALYYCLLLTKCRGTNVWYLLVPA